MSHTLLPNPSLHPTCYGLGSELIPHGRWRSRHAGTVASLGTIDPKLASKAGAVTINEHTFEGVFSHSS